MPRPACRRIPTLSARVRFPARHALAVLGLGLTTAAGAAADPAAGRPAHAEASEPGAFCTPTSCRPAAASPWTAAAFGAAALAIGWQARRRHTPDR